MAPVLAFVNLKGGVGKTTSALITAEVAAEALGSALLVDADPQGSAMSWAEIAADEMRAVTVSLPTTDLTRRLAGIGAGYPLVVVDTPPAGLGIVQAAARIADLVVIPCQPTTMDVARLRSTIETINETGRKGVVMLTRVRSGARTARDAREALEAAGVEILEAEIPERVAFGRAYGQAPTTDDVLDPYRAVWAELKVLLMGVPA